MKTYPFTGVFNNGINIYNETVYCDSFTQAFILLTANAINNGKHYQLESITDDEEGVTKQVNTITNMKFFI